MKELLFAAPLLICIVLVAQDVGEPGFFFQTTTDFFRVLPILMLSKPSLYFLAYYCSFFMPLISENKLYKIGVFNLCCDSNKITVLNSCVVLVEAQAAEAYYQWCTISVCIDLKFD